MKAMGIDKWPLNYDYPESLVALKPEEPCRVLYMRHEASDFKEIALKGIGQIFSPGDVLVINTSGVKACRVFSTDQKREVLFLKENEEDENTWSVLFNSRDLKVGDSFELPGDLMAELIAKGRPQSLKLSKKISLDYFNEFGQMALPPYIQKARGLRKILEDDFYWYQLDWKKNQNSLAAPTASLHFKQEDIERLSKEYGVEVAEVSLDVGLGTFLPLEQKNFDESKLHKETFTVPVETKEKIFKAIENKNRVWALGTTALRAVESMSDTLTQDQSQTELFIYPGYEFKYISGLLTNFHQPNSSLLLLVMALFGVEETLKAYRFAVDKKFRLFSYGDLSVWTKPVI
jgi:S-adenosylmethionine:tRNA ribosyltransferase-isomerase